MLKKVLVLLAVLILFPVVAFGLGTNEYIGIDAPKPLFCGTGTVTVKGTVLVNQGNQFTIAKVYFARFGQTLQLMYSNNVPKDSQVHDWEFQAQIIQGVKYDMSIGNSNGLFHCAFCTARVRPPYATLLPLEHAPRYTLFAPRHREPPAAPAHEASCWPARSAAGRPPGSAGPDGLLVTGSGPPHATRNRRAGDSREGLLQTLQHTRMMLPKGGGKPCSSCPMDAKKRMARCGGVTHTGRSRTHWECW